MLCWHIHVVDCLLGDGYCRENTLCVVLSVRVYVVLVQYIVDCLLGDGYMYVYDIQRRENSVHVLGCEL